MCRFLYQASSGVPKLIISGTTNGVADLGVARRLRAANAREARSPALAIACQCRAADAFATSKNLRTIARHEDPRSKDDPGLLRSRTSSSYAVPGATDVPPARRGVAACMGACAMRGPSCGRRERALGALTHAPWSFRAVVRRCSKKTRFRSAVLRLAKRKPSRMREDAAVSAALATGPVIDLR
jgi:hypothetical protein